MQFGGGFIDSDRTHMWPMSNTTKNVSSEINKAVHVESHNFFFCLVTQEVFKHNSRLGKFELEETNNMASPRVYRDILVPV